jgi:hypothetical protein
MGLSAALVDRARVVERRESGRRVEGRTVYGEARLPWFKARLELVQAPENTEESGVRPVVSQPTLLTGVRDLEGNQLELGNDVRLEVDSRQLGHTVWQIVGEPAPLRKKRTLIGWQASLRKVTVREAARRAE